MPHAILTPVDNGTYRVSNVGTPAFWPHDGDVICAADIKLLTAKGWTVIIQGK